MDIKMTMLTFRDVTAPRDRKHFFSIFETRPLFWPDRIRDNRGRRFPFSGEMDQQEAVWSHGDRLTLVRGEQKEVRISVNVANEEMRRVTGSFLYVTADSSLFRDPSRLLEFVDLGNQLYSLLQPCYAFLSLPGFPPLFGTALPKRGLPGWGWATWLGPEYRELVYLSAGHGVGVTDLQDGGRLYLFPLPSDVLRLDAACAEAHRFVLESLDPRLFQIHPPAMAPELSEAQQKEMVGQYAALDLVRRRTGVVKVPRFRFRDVSEA